LFPGTPPAAVRGRRTRRGDPRPGSPATGGRRMAHRWPPPDRRLDRNPACRPDGRTAGGQAMTEGKLSGRTALVTGGAGAIGAACAEALLRDGAAVGIMGRKAASLEATRDALLEVVPEGRIDISPGDALSPGDVQIALDRAHGTAGRLDIIVATVGGGGFKPLLMHDVDSFRGELDQNIISAFIALRYGAPLMRNGGSVVCISSTAAT